MIGKKAEFAIFFWNGTKRRNREKAKKKKRVQARIYVYTYMCVYTKKDEKWGERDTRLTRLLENTLRSIEWIAALCDDACCFASLAQFALLLTFGREPPALN